MNPYQKEIEGKDPIAVLEATPRRLRELAAGLSPAQLQAPPAPGKWSIHEIVAHLADSELMFSSRCRFILYEENKPLIAFDQDALMTGWRREQEPFEDTLDRFRILRQAQLRMFRAATPADLARTASHEEYGTESASEYMFKVAGHDLRHLEQIERLRKTVAAAPSMDHIMQVGFGFWASKTLLSALEMEVFTELAKHPEDLETLQGRMGLHPRSARDFLDTLVALGFLERIDGKYRNTPSTDVFLDKRKPTYVGGMLEMANHRLYPFWGDLTTALRTGLPQNEIKTGGPGLFTNLYADPDRLKQFLKAMTGLSRGANLAIARQFPWKGYKTAVDVGTAQGDLMVQVALANPHIAGCGFDLAEVGPIFEEYVEQNGLAGRVQFSAGSFFDHPLPKADVVMMGHILHDWNLEEKRMLIRKGYEALPEGGALIIYESIIDDDRSKNAFGLMMSLNMLIETPGGFDYTGADCMGWMKEAGFRQTRVEHLVGPDSMVVGIK